MACEIERPALDVQRHEAASRRDHLFRETALERLERWALGTAWALKPERIAGVPGLLGTVMSDLVAPPRGLPDPEKARQEPPGLCGVARGLSPATLVEAYRRGLFAFAHVGRPKWFSPPERCVLSFEKLHIGKRVRRDLRRGVYRVSLDRDFEGVIKACAGRRAGRWHVTWITPAVMHAFAELYDAGHVHSFEVWNAAGALVGGGYGLALGRTFFTESQFSLEANTSKVGFTVLNWHLARWGFVLNDAKYPTPTLLDMGFRNIPRGQFLSQLREGNDARLKPGRWQIETDLEAIAAWQPARRPPQDRR